MKYLEGLQYRMPFQMFTVPESLETIPETLHITVSFTLHNHPTGDPSPSSEDIQITRRLKEAGELLGISILDHIVIGDGQYLSFVEKGLL